MIRLKCYRCSKKEAVATCHNDEYDPDYVVPMCDKCSADWVDKFGDEANRKENVSLLWAMAVRKYPNLVMDESGDSVPDLQVRAEDNETGEASGGSDGWAEAFEKIKSIEHMYECKWHGREVEHDVPQPDYGARTLVIEAGERYIIQQIEDINDRLHVEHHDSVRLHVANTMREWPTCCGNLVDTKFDGKTVTWHCPEHGGSDVEDGE